MTYSRCAMLLPFAWTLAFGQSAPRSHQSILPNQPDGLAHSLYEQVVIHHPSGIPSGKNWIIFKPYMSTELLHRIALFNACVADWDRGHNRDSRYLEKPPFRIFESGMFSGGDELTAPRAFHIDRTEPQNDGTIRVYVTLKWWETEKPIDKYQVSAEKPYIWQVALVLVQQDNRLFVNNVVFLNDKSDPSSHERQLSEELSYGCDGPYYVGNREH